MDPLSNAEWWHRLIGPLLEADEVELQLGLDGRELRELISRRELLALPWQGGLVFPAFQFAYDGRPYPLLPEILALFADTPPFQVAAWFRTTQPLLEDVPPWRWLELKLEKEQLLQAAAHKAKQLREERKPPQP